MAKRITILWKALDAGIKSDTLDEEELHELYAFIDARFDSGFIRKDEASDLLDTISTTIKDAQFERKHNKS